MAYLWGFYSSITAQTSQAIFFVTATIGVRVRLSVTGPALRPCGSTRDVIRDKFIFCVIFTETIIWYIRDNMVY